MLKSLLVSFVVALAVTIAIGVALEAMRRRGLDPVARLADVVSPPTMAPDADPGGASAHQATDAAGAAS
jgi:hypothetical protein